MSEIGLEIGCSCGAVALRLEPKGVASATRLRCYCIDCQTAARYLGYALPAHGGTELIQSTPDRVSVLSGQDNLGILRLSSNGLIRWYATCCNTPMLNMIRKPGLPFVGLVLHEAELRQADKTMGPNGGHVFTKYARKGQGAPAKDVNFNGIGLNIVKRMLGAYLTGRHRKNPFVSPAGDWPVTPKVLTIEERAAASKAVGAG